jgi:putative transposase
MLYFIQPGKPTQNSHIERFTRTYRDELLDLYLFRALREVRQMTEEWMVRYNNERPHDSLNDMTPAEFLQVNNRLGNSNPVWN